jgi:hypothetical protein
MTVASTSPWPSSSPSMEWLINIIGFKVLDKQRDRRVYPIGTYCDTVLRLHKA